MSKNEKENENKEKETEERKKFEKDRQRFKKFNAVYKDLSANVTIAENRFNEFKTSTATFSAFLGDFIDRKLEKQDIERKALSREFEEWKRKLNPFVETIDTVLSMSKQVAEKRDEVIFQRIESVKEILTVRIDGVETIAKDAKTDAKDAKNTATKISWIHVALVALTFIFVISVVLVVLLAVLP